GDGHPAEIMDMSFAIQALSARYLVQHQGVLPRAAGQMLHPVPREIDEAVARRLLSIQGIHIDTLTPAQREYLYGPLA
ncbi:MAG: adenosylhomocysteinase, partial [Bacteroidales bacterium]|nr:adenosylhomocysteinase [Bacteroidales bacterium]